MFSDFELAPLETPDALLDQLELSFTDTGNLLPAYDLDYATKYNNYELKDNHYRLLDARHRHSQVAYETWMLSCVAEKDWLMKKPIDNMFYTAVYELRSIELQLINNQLLCQSIGFDCDLETMSGLEKVMKKNCVFLFGEGFDGHVDVAVSFKDKCVSVAAMIHLLARHVTELVENFKICDLAKRFGFIIHMMNRVCRVNK
jgi:hypothetical protein